MPHSEAWSVLVIHTRSHSRRRDVRLYFRPPKAKVCYTIYINYASRRDVQALLSIIESDGLPHNVYKLCVEKRCTGFTVDHRKRRTATQCIKKYVSKRDVQALLSTIESDGLPHNVYKLCV